MGPYIGKSNPPSRKKRKAALKLATHRYPKSPLLVTVFGVYEGRVTWGFDREPLRGSNG